ncbi:MAG: ribosome biogenesis GTPase Der [Bacteroidetes bacterium]|nr:ribosome biogenesis GTPase Der [Bacteroidota bacterium]
MLPVVSIVGRPNVGKSTLFNRLIGERKAIVHDLAGVTRDRHYGESFWGGREFSLIDTGGYVPDDQDVMMQGIREQVHLAVDESDVILFIVDVETGITDLDKNIADLLRRQKRPVLVIANKADNEQRSWQASEFYALGYDEIFSVSSVNGTGTGDLLDRVVELFPEPQEHLENDTPKLAIVGRPNVGKSSMVNALLGYQRSIVTDIAGTTRDSINSDIIYNDKQYILVDTAGLRRKTKVNESVEFYSTLRTHKAVREADIVVLIIDAVQGFEAQDIRILAEAERFNKGIILVLNKWDLVEKDTNTFKDYVEAVYEKIPTMKYIPVLTTSALTKQRIFKILELTDEVLEERGKKISTSHLNKFIEDVTKERPVPVARGVQLKIKYATQVKTNPPVFAFFMNKPSDLPANYRRFLENRIRDTFGFSGVPITMVFKEK